MIWKQVSIATNEEGTDLVSSILIDAGAGGVEIHGGSMPIPEQDAYLSPLFDVKPDVFVKAYYGDTGFDQTLSFIKKRLTALRNASETDVGSLTIHIDSVPDTDWNAGFKKHFTTFCAAGHVVIKPTWEDYKPKDGDIVIEMDPGIAFGSGTHETTRMCLDLVQKHMKPGASVMDVGCGSGILGIACAKLGACRVTALDYDNVSVDVTRANAQANGADMLDVRQSDLLENADDTRYDIVLANIIADIIIRLNRDVGRILTEDAVYIMSGIIKDRLQDVLDSLEENGFNVIETLTLGEWCAVAAKTADRGLPRRSR